jgi:hypothetical protein
MLLAFASIGSSLHAPLATKQSTPMDVHGAGLAQHGDGVLDSTYHHVATSVPAGLSASLQNLA